MNYGLHPSQLRGEIIRPVLRYLGLHSQSAEALVIGTALVESNARYVRQLGNGPALGIWQMEPATHDDIWDNFLRYNYALRIKVSALATPAAVTPGAREMAGNLFYGAAMCRLHYWRVAEPLPTIGDYVGLAKYWKTHYNTHRGAGSVSEALPHFEAIIEA